MIQLDLFAPTESTSSLEELHAKASPLRESEKDSKGSRDLRTILFDFFAKSSRAISCGKMCQGHCPPSQTDNGTSIFSSVSMRNAGMILNGEFWTGNMCEWNISLAPFLKEGGVCSLSDILQRTEDIGEGFYLSKTACEGILRRAASRGKALPAILEKALRAQIARWENGGGYENHQTDARVKSVDCAPCMGAEQNSRPANNNPLIIEPIDVGHECAIGIDTYNQEATKEVSKTINTAAAQDTDHTGGVAIPFSLRGNRREGEEGKPPETDRVDSMVATAKAIGIGVDAFNSGVNAKLAMSITEEVQPTQTSNRGGQYA